MMTAPLHRTHNDAGTGDPDLGEVATRAAKGDVAARRFLAARLSASPLQSALFGGDPDPLDDQLAGFAALLPLYRDSMAGFGIARPGKDYLFDLLLPLVRFLGQRARVTSRPYLLGLAGGPGAGKTTLSRLLSRCLQAVMTPPPACLSISIDDFYLSKGERQRRGFKWRTLPGTHDTRRIADFITALDRPREAGLTVPRYDLGRDAPMADEVLAERPDICIFDGAMVGSPLPGYDNLARRLDFLIYLDLPVPLLKHWRFERERKLREESGGTVGFSEAQMRAFWDEALGPSLATWVAPNAARADLVLQIDADRRVRAARHQPECERMRHGA